MSTLLKYENQIYLDMYHNDALIILAEGLGIERIFANFIKLYTDPTQLVMIVNTEEAEEEYFMNVLKETKVNEDILPTKITTETHTVNERAQAYFKGGCFFVTSRILVVDMLTDRIPIDLITGILVYNAHKIIDSCQETFILRMFRQKNKKGFIKAFSDKPVYFSKSFCKVEKIMKNLFVRKLFLYPRFHVDIDTELSKFKPEVVEIHVGLSENANRIQMALMDIISVLLQEFKGCCTYIDHDFLTMEMVISKPFDKIVKGQLEPVWNQLGSKPKQLLSDIRTLRLLLYYLTQYDCITFYKMLNCLRSHEKELGRSSGWMFLDAANELFLKARKRVYKDETKSLTKADLNNRYLYSKENKAMAANIMEESPKLKALKEVLEEIGNEKSAEPMNILITANDDRTCSQIKHFLLNNRISRMMKNANQNLEELEKQFDKFDVVNERNELEQENDEEFIVKMILKPIKQDDDETNSKYNKNKKRKKNADCVTLTQMVRKNEEKNREKTTENSDDEDTDDDNSDNDMALSELSNKSNNTNLFLSALEGGARQSLSLVRLLHKIQPKYVVLYDIELRFVRQLELYQSLNYQDPMRVYFLMYTNSIEEQKYLTSVRSEKEAFEILVREKATMIIPEEQDGKVDLPKQEPDDETKPTISSQMSKFAEKSKSKVDNESPKVIVDMREFRSELPSLLHKRGFQIEPVTLEVGDYVITPTICVERKSINDLIESLANGRLYNQCNAMSRCYKTPVLLIEFDQNKPFLLNTYQALVSNEINIQHTSSKLVLLTIHFPQLRILWCSSPSETAEIFEELKANCPQPDAQTAMSIKADQIYEDADLKFNPMLWDMLLKIPGINSKNIKSIMTNVENLSELCNLSEERINEIIENSKNAKLIYEFFNTTKKDTNLLNELDFEDLKDFYEESAKMQSITTSKTKKKTLVKSGSKAASNTTKKATKSKKAK